MNHSVQSRVVLPGVLIFVLGCGISNGKQDSRPANQKPAQLPFAISIVPTSSNVEPYGRGIAMAKKSPDAFYVILTNTSKEPQLVFEPWNSWGYRAVSFEVETADGHKFAISKKPQKFTVIFRQRSVSLPASTWSTPSA
jgi:hypothetical protein